MKLNIVFANTEIQSNLIVPNSWNINKQTSRTFQAQKESIDNYGMIDPIIVRKISNAKFLKHQLKIEERIGQALNVEMQVDYKFEIIDGEHRLLACLALGLTYIPCTLIECDSDDQAKKLTLIFIETRGAADKLDVASLLQSINLDDEELILGLPYQENELEELLNLDLDEIDNIDPEKNNPPPDSNDEPTGWTRITVLLPNNFIDVFNEAYSVAKEEAGNELHKDQEIAYGQFLEIVIANYLAG